MDYASALRLLSRRWWLILLPIRCDRGFVFAGSA